MPKILISYRRGDADPTAYRIHETLLRRHDEKSVFIDIDNIPFGADFREHIKSVLKEIDVLLAIIGPNWLSELRRRQADKKIDYVRLEIDTALKRGIPVIPILVQAAEMPDPSEMPDTLEKLAFLNALEVDTGRDFKVHIERLSQRIDEILGQQAEVEKPVTEVEGAETKVAKPEDYPPSDNFLQKSMRVFLRSREVRVGVSLICISFGLLLLLAAGFPNPSTQEAQVSIVGAAFIYLGVVYLLKRTRLFSIAVGFAIHGVAVILAEVVDLSSLILVLLPLFASIIFTVFDNSRADAD